jgi:hypothetical protein
MMKYKEMMLKDTLKHIPKENTPYLDLWYSDNLELCFQIKLKNEPHNGIIIEKKDVKRLAVFIAEFLNKTNEVKG